MNNPLIKIDNINIEQQISDKSQEEVIKALKIALEPFGIAMAMISDRLTLWRMSNLIKITDKAKTMLVGKGLKAEAVEKNFCRDLSKNHPTKMILIYRKCGQGC
ncbi:MAG: hypothetical protein IPH06_06980 [Alphaproteobacteria bacterium]|nr:hypothetical protein [Alphaproteobacteria bacterium]